MESPWRSQRFILLHCEGCKETPRSARHWKESWWVGSTTRSVSRYTDKCSVQPLSLVVKTPSKQPDRHPGEVESQQAPRSRWTRFTSVFRPSPGISNQNLVGDVQLQEVTRQPPGPAAVSTVIVMPSATHPRLLDPKAPVQDVGPTHLPEVGLGHADIPYKPR